MTHEMADRDIEPFSFFNQRDCVMKWRNLPHIMESTPLQFQYATVPYLEKVSEALEQHSETNFGPNHRGFYCNADQEGHINIKCRQARVLLRFPGGAIYVTTRPAIIIRHQSRVEDYPNAPLGPVDIHIELYRLNRGDITC